MGCAAVGATIYFGSAETNRQIIEVSHAFQQAHELGMATVLWCYTRNNAFKTKEKDFHVSADLTGQANHLGVTICADIIKQKLPENNGGYLAIQATESSYGKIDKRMYTDLSTDHPIDLTRYQVANCYMGRIGLINSGGPSGNNDFAEAVTALQRTGCVPHEGEVRIRLQYWSCDHPQGNGRPNIADHHANRYGDEQHCRMSAVRAVRFPTPVRTGSGSAGTSQRTTNVAAPRANRGSLCRSFEPAPCKSCLAPQ
jgi:hypothetical protein